MAAAGTPPPRALSAELRSAPLSVGLAPPRHGTRVRASWPLPRQETVGSRGRLLSTMSSSRSLLCSPCRCAQVALADAKIAYQPDAEKHAGVLGRLQRASIKKRGPHTVASTAFDVLKLIGQLRLSPRVLVGHSFGGKVALSMVEQAAKPLPRPVRVWVLDATPGKVRAGLDGEDHPAELIEVLRRMPVQVNSKQEVVDALVKAKFSVDVARWVATNLRRSSPSGPRSSPSFSWIFDLNGISEMYKSYEDTNLWRIVENVPRGVHINFLKAERSLHRWALEDLQRIHTAEEVAADEAGGVEMHVLEDAGHWVHADNPDGLFRILSSTFRVETSIRGVRG